MIIAPVLTLGIHDDRERELNMQPGNIIVLSSSGDIERLTVLYAMIAARASLLDIDGKDKIRVKIVMPIGYTYIDLMKRAVIYHLQSSGKEERVEIKYVTVQTENENAESIESDDYDVYINLFVDFYMKESKNLSRFMNVASIKKKDRIILLNRFDRKKKILTEKCDDEIIVESVKRGHAFYDRMDDPLQPWNGTVAGSIYMKGEKVTVSYQIRFPFALK
jgi:hypothetical protein